MKLFINKNAGDSTTPAFFISISFNVMKLQA